MDRTAPYKRIATEEAWNIPEILAAQLDLFNSACPPDDSALRMVGQFAKAKALQESLFDVGPGRIARMDELGIDKQLLLLTAPGVQVLDPDKGTALATLANDRLSETCRKYPDRFAGLTAFAPQNVRGAVAEIERGMTKLGLKGAVLNSTRRGAISTSRNSCRFSRRWRPMTRRFTSIRSRRRAPGRSLMNFAASRGRSPVSPTRSGSM